MNTSNLALLATVIAFCLSAHALAEATPQTPGQDARVCHFNWSSSDVIRVKTSLRVNTAVALGAGERINPLLWGDSETLAAFICMAATLIQISERQKAIVGDQEYIRFYLLARH